MSKEQFDFFEEDAKLVVEEAEDLAVAQRAFLDVDDALLEWDAYIQGLSVEEAQTALEGLREYADAFVREREIEQGWHRGLDA